MDKKELIKETGLTDSDLQELRESFVEKYTMKMGWDKNDLSKDQLLEIQQQDGYRKPGMLLS